MVTSDHGLWLSIQLYEPSFLRTSHCGRLTLTVHQQDKTVLCQVKVHVLSRLDQRRFASAPRLPRMLPSQAPRLPLRIFTDTGYSDRPHLSLDDSPLSPSSDPGLTTSASSSSSGASDWAICQVLCMFDFESPDSDQLSFNKDEVLTVIKQEESGWWAAMRSDGDRIGWIPSSFVEPLPEVDEALEYQQYTSCILDDHREPGIYYSDGDELWVPVFEDVKVLHYSLCLTS